MGAILSRLLELRSGMMSLSPCTTEIKRRDLHGDRIGIFLGICKLRKYLRCRGSRAANSVGTSRILILVELLLPVCTVVLLHRPPRRWRCAPRSVRIKSFRFAFIHRQSSISTATVAEFNSGYGFVSERSSITSPFRP
ncbi:uncharacterized protein K489DRAFT_6299 [Dissoconium aciculare CBS 342.82]|uniref:Uncharacterized protein n=1 Tax=Dissoconium aciculare CBS 342.82 TaxID=1314786 RepID=A0A6J3MGK0_9PEZI|nr:uncharacterized protein K489DRAFT_6299 [Dissoconium aciculare CBS 342.82]KAF1827086.1 hypothetical protein K489DRAFT_6299 [Dissoconium aciculare CBS 342.82]